MLACVLGQPGDEIVKITTSFERENKGDRCHFIVIVSPPSAAPEDNLLVKPWNESRIHKYVDLSQFAGAKSTVKFKKLVDAHKCLEYLESAAEAMHATRQKHKSFGDDIQQSSTGDRPRSRLEGQSSRDLRARLVRFDERQLATAASLLRGETGTPVNKKNKGGQGFIGGAAEKNVLSENTVFSSESTSNSSPEPHDGLPPKKQKTTNHRRETRSSKRPASSEANAARGNVKRLQIGNRACDVDETRRTRSDKATQQARRVDVEEEEEEQSKEAQNH
uniref:Uncharacterized protein n=1 Tax=Octactis speculum TaxID=3111310 RepID=A0A7S2GUL7_9STRA|mmetsp:Transcript_56875/g.77548  ORF Transcript_56875/g.77548 Transcript_56875/m.77548 type:complete len:277 (+) Transcript_56875:172-1002(+)